ncbi:MAG: hypothetical protein ACREM8_00590 [Vulcanimicrobiaceae bacterium]
MLPEPGDLAMLGFDTNPASLARLSSADSCELCGVEPLPPDGSRAAIVTWCRRFRPDLAEHFAAERDLASGRSGHLDAAHPWYAGDPLDTELLRLRYDTRTQLSVVIDLDVLEAIEPQLDPEQREFVENELAVVACADCRSRGRGEISAADFAETHYLGLRFDGNRAAAHAQPTWKTAQGIFAHIARARARERSF